MNIGRTIASITIGIIVLFEWGAAASIPSPAVLSVGAFSQYAPSDIPPPDWEKVTFSNIENRTTYRLVRQDGNTVIKAQSRFAASGMIRNLDFDAAQYPWLTWRWKIERVLDQGDLRIKTGDDYAARLYVAFKFDPQKASLWERMLHAMASTRAGKELPGTVLTYIWANKAPQGTAVDNPYTAQAKMIALRSGNQEAGHWKTEKRNIADDYLKLFGDPPPPCMGIGIMTDTDNTGESTTAYYGDIILSHQEHI